jgi:UDP-3-O-[3-hydroxymyristoyl] glucosamine N-acyltransferase
MKNIIFLGASGNFKKFTAASELAGYQCLGIIDDHYYGNTEHWEDVPVIGGESKIKEFLSTCPSDVEFFVSVPLLMRTSPVTHEKRLRLIDVVDEYDLPCANLISPFSQVGDDVELGKGVWVGFYSVIQHGCAVADHAWVRDLCFIGHGSRVGKGTLISTQSYLGGDIYVGEHSLTGIKSTFTARNPDPIYIGNNTMTHPGTVVHDSIGSNVEFCPGGRIKPRPTNMRYAKE